MKLLPIVVGVGHFLITILSAASYACSSQPCFAKETGFQLFALGKKGLITEMFEQSQVSDSDHYQIMLINSYGGQVNRAEAFYLSIDNENKINILKMTADSLYFSECINPDDKYQLDFLPNYEGSNAILMGECPRVLSSHTRSVFMVLNHSRQKRIEFYSLDGYAKEEISNGDHQFVKSCYFLLEKVFRDFYIDINR